MGFANLPGSGGVTGVERQLDASHLSATFIASAFLLVVETFHVDVPFEWVPGVEVDGDSGGTALHFRFSFDAVVDRNTVGSSHKKGKDDELHLQLNQ